MSDIAANQSLGLESQCIRSDLQKRIVSTYAHSLLLISCTTRCKETLTTSECPLGQAELENAGGSNPTGLDVAMIAIVWVLVQLVLIWPEENKTNHRKDAPY